MDCSSYISGPALQECGLGREVTFGNVSSGCTWRCADVAHYCYRTAATTEFWYRVHSVFVTGPNLQVHLFAVIGLISNALLFLTLLSPKLSGTVFTFLKFITAAHLGQGILVIVTRGYGIGYLPVHVKYFVEVMAAQPFLNSVKLNVVSLTFFMALDRFLAMAKATFYNTINHKKFIRTAIVVSFFIGCLEVEAVTEFLITFYTRDNVTQFMGTLNSWGRHRFYPRYLIHVITAYKIAVLLAISIFGLTVLAKLRERARRITKMVTAESAAKEFKEMASLCRFQLVDTVAMIFDILFSLCATLASTFAHLSFPYYVSCRIEDKYYYMNVGLASDTLYFIGKVFEAFAHGELFLIYLLFFAKFRAAFYELVKKIRFCNRNRTPEPDTLVSGVGSSSHSARPRNRGGEKT